ncbi:MAG: GNAT family N-acetyltransferase [Ruminococcaceae bacterium]|nr:GNAT family N-acetyltransferase [Oscillospiraceae bacterium]
MENNTFYCGRGYDIPYADFMELINVCFNFTTPEQKFEGLLTKCYREHYRPQDQNYVVIDENGTLTTAVGAYDHEITVCGRVIPCRGIGNVGVHPDHRSKGHMKLAMNKALEDMKKDGIVLSTLGGRRQRYQYFGFDKAGPQYVFNVSRANIHHIYGDFSSPYNISLVTDPADPIIDEIIRITEKCPFIPIRAREKYLDIANSWKARLLVFTDPADNDRFVGYCIMDKNNSLSEIRTDRDIDFMNAVRSVFAYLDDGFSINIPSFDIAYASALSLIAEGHTYGSSMMYCILNYAKAVDAFMALKLTYASLPDGKLTMKIHGYAGDETISVTVKDGIHTVESVSDDTSADLELSHLEATELLFCTVSPSREIKSPLIRAWFPLPIYMYRADEV